ncbi:MAG: hypothetical protein ACOYOU_07380 [Kiritimatiellia bacterium]
MKAVLHVGASRTWTNALGPLPWPLVPLGNRALIEYWFELGVDLGISEFFLVLGDGADQIEAYAGDGSQWGLRLQYSFLREDRASLSFLKRKPELGRDGLLFLSGPLFPRRLAASRLLPPAATGLYLQKAEHGSLVALCTDAAAWETLLGGAFQLSRNFSEIGLEPVPVESTREFFALNMQLAAGEISRYLAPGYGSADGSCVGYNVVIPPSADVAPTVILGNDCRIGPLTSVGPCAVVGNHVVIDREAQLTRCVVLADTYVGRQVEIREKIASGGRLIDPEDGEFLDLEDTWLLARLPQDREARDVCRALTGWLFALLLLCLQLVPCAIGYGLLRLFRRGRFERRQVYGPRQHVLRLRLFQPAEGARDTALVRGFYALSLDLTPRLFGAVLGRWWLCGHEPLRAPEDQALRNELTAYFPAVFSYATARCAPGERFTAPLEARYYVQHRGVLEDLLILRRALIGRFARMFRRGKTTP